MGVAVKDLQAVADFLLDTRGAALHVLYAMWAIGQPAAIARIAQVASVYKSTARAALERLDRKGYAVEIDGWWQLTGRGRQLPMPGFLLASLCEVEGEKFTLEGSGGSSSSSTLDQRAEFIRKEQLLLLPDEARVNNSPLSVPAEGRACVELLVENGVDRGRAERAVVSALVECGNSPEYVEQTILDCLVYADSPQGESIKAAGYYAAKRIENDEQAPFYDEDPEHHDPALPWRVWRRRNVAYLERLGKSERSVGREWQEFLEKRRKGKEAS